MRWFKFLLVAVFLFTAVFAFSDQTLVYETFDSTALTRWMPVSGSWKVVHGRLTQTDANERMAMISIPVEQSGVILYEFDAKYVTGGADDYAGFGIHICTNNPTKKRSWGNGTGLLGWVTWDPKAYGYPGGFLHVYDSRNASNMELSKRIFPSGDIMKYGDLLPIPAQYLKTKYLEYKIPIKMRINTRTGAGRFYDPFAPDRYYYRFSLGGPVTPGDYFTFRTNSLSVSFDNLKITKID
ncbi:MAG: hypothetical protein JXQ30_06710 [Spirochaetes bacterium]|nr:hypothetical protein [Spirochaetota bacterium]